MTNSIRRIVPNIYSDELERSKQFYTEFLEMDLVMDMGWILTFASSVNPTAQLSIFQNDHKKPLDNSAIFLSFEVADVDRLYERGLIQKIDIVYPITDEAWGVRRFFVMDPNGVTLNLLSHER
ncbi:VOC family protein [Membranicola marinus]|uniref:VOC family protein n=1 Tax=Membranihabitans marinus TaxID=1227546 RepID=A0A953LBK4_9BACT|nr:VOC family protein [Membranihabitans marinus]MBY5956729.1 VOC family protein [Membranihabitans marinus]